MINAIPDSSRNGSPSYRSIYNIFGPTESGEVVPGRLNLPPTYVLSYPGIVFKFSLPDTSMGKPISNKDLRAYLHTSDSHVLAAHLAIYSGAKWNDFRRTLTEPRPRLGAKRNMKEKRALSQSLLEQVEYVEIFPNEKVELKFFSGKTVVIAYNVFTAQDAISVLGPPGEVYTKSDNRLDIHNKLRHDDTESGPLSDGIS